MASPSGISSNMPDDFKTEDNLKSSISGNIQTDHCEIDKTDDDLYKNLKDIVPGFQICEEVFSSSHNYLEERCDYIKNKLNNCKDILNGPESLKTQIKHINVLVSELSSCGENISTMRNAHMSLKKDFGNCLLFMKSAGEGLIKHYKHMNTLLVRCKQLVKEKRQYLNVDILQMVCKQLSECQNMLWHRTEEEVEEVAAVAIFTDTPKIEEDQSKLETLNQQLKSITENFETLKRQHEIDQMKYKELSDKFKSTVKEVDEYSKEDKPELDIDTQDDLKLQLAKTQADLNFMLKQHQILFEKNNNLIADNQRLTDECEKLKQSLQEQHEIKEQILQLTENLKESEKRRKYFQDKMQSLENIVKEYHSGPCLLKIPVEENRVQQISLKHGDGLIILCIEELIFSVHSEFARNNPSPIILVSWKLKNQNTAYTPPKEGLKIMFNYSEVYSVTFKESLYTYLQEEELFLNVYHCIGNECKLIAQGPLEFTQILNFPDQPQHSTVPLLGADKWDSDTSMGEIYCSVSLSAAPKIMENFKEFSKSQKVKAGEHLQTKKIKEPLTVTEFYKRGASAVAEQKADKSETISHSKDKESLLDHFKIDKKDESEFSFDNDLQFFDATSKEFKSESVEKETKQILSEEKKVVEDSISADHLLLHDISKRCSEELKETFQDDVFPKTYFTEDDDKKENEDDMSEIRVDIQKGLVGQVWQEKKQSTYDEKIGIEINDLILQPDSDAMLNPHIKGFYITYAFLGHRGAQMETPKTIHIKDAVNGTFSFNFRKEFSVDPVTHPKRNSILRKMFHSTEEDLHKIYFIVVGEHLDENLPGYKWTDVGYSELDMMTLIAFPGDRMVVDLSVISLIEGDNIGTLKIAVDGINVIKYVATNETINSKKQKQIGPTFSLRKKR